MTPAPLLLPTTTLCAQRYTRGTAVRLNRIARLDESAQRFSPATIRTAMRPIPDRSPDRCSATGWLRRCDPTKWCYAHSYATSICCRRPTPCSPTPTSEPGCSPCSKPRISARRSPRSARRPERNSSPLSPPPDRPQPDPTPNVRWIVHRVHNPAHFSGLGVGGSGLGLGFEFVGIRWAWYRGQS